MPVTSAITKATAPITGGMNCPPDDAAASTPPAKELLKPRSLIIGIVKTPVPTTFAETLPEMVPKKPLAAIAAWAGPPRKPPVRLTAIRSRTAPAPVASSTAPKTMKMKISEITVMTMKPKTPSKEYQTVRMTVSRS